MMSGVPSKITGDAAFDEIQKPLERMKLDMGQVQHLIAVVRSNGLAQSSSRTNATIQNETLGTVIDLPESIKSKMCTLAPILAKRDGGAKK